MENLKFDESYQHHNNKHGWSAMGIYQDDPSTVIIVKNPKWLFFNNVEGTVKNGFSHESIHSALVSMGMFKESTKYDRVAKELKHKYYSGM